MLTFQGVNMQFYAGIPAVLTARRKFGQSSGYSSASRAIDLAACLRLLAQ